MEKHIAWIGNPYFVHQLQGGEYSVTTIPARFSPLTWTDICDACGSRPDLLIYGDSSVPPFIQDIENFPCATVFYAVDTHIHSWYPRYAQAFDLCCVAMRDHIPGFLGHVLAAEQILWLPLFSKDSDRRLEGVEKRYEVLFVGKNDRILTPGRFELLGYLSSRIPLTVCQGQYRELYAQAKVVLNVSEHGDLNFRVFEALGCGSCLLTPRVGHGLLDLFRDGEELVTYDAGDRDGIVRMAESLLADEERRQRIAASGEATVNAVHRTLHRTGQLATWIKSFDLDALVQKRLERQDVIRRDYLRLLYLHLADAESDIERVRMYLDFAGQGLAI